MRFRIVTGHSFALFLIAACGGSVATTDSDDDGANDNGGGGGGSSFDDGGVSSFDSGFVGSVGGSFDAGFGGDDGGLVDLDGASSSPPPPSADAAPQGPRDAGPLSGALLRDANGALLGEIISIQSEGAVFTIVTPNDYVIDINLDGTFPLPGAGAFLYSATDCGGTIYLQGSTYSSEMLGSRVVYSSNRSSLMIPAGPLTSAGAATSVPVSWLAVGDPCENGSSTLTHFYGWPLVPTTAANIGLPDPIVAPLSYP